MRAAEWVALAGVAVLALVLLRKRSANGGAATGGGSITNGAAPSSGYDADDPYATGAPSTPLPSTGKTGYVTPTTHVTPSTGPTIETRKGRGHF